MASECAACGGELGDSPYTIGKGSYWGEVSGAVVCGRGGWSGCKSRGSGAVKADILARRSAPQPPKSAEGRPVMVGDYVGIASATDSPRCFEGTVLEVGSESMGSVQVKVHRPEGHRLQSTTPFWYAPASALCHLHPDAAPAGAGKPKPHYREGSDMARLEKRIRAEKEPVAAPSLAAFTAAVEKHLLPRLPKGWRCVTDVIGRVPVPGTSRTVATRNVCFSCWVIDERGKEAHRFERFASQMSTIGAERLDGEAARVAAMVMSRLARPASELERGRE